MHCSNQPEAFSSDLSNDESPYLFHNSLIGMLESEGTAGYLRITLEIRFGACCIHNTVAA